MKPTIKNLLFVLIGIIILGGIFFYYKKPAGIGQTANQSTAQASDPVTKAPATNATVNTTGLPLKLPAGFSIQVFAKNLPDARVMAFDSTGNLWVSQTSAGKISELIIQNGKVVKQQTALSGLKNPHGLAFDPQNSKTLYFAEETKISKFTVGAPSTVKKIADLPNSGGDHITRTIGFGPDGRLYVSIGSACNICTNTDSRRAAVSSMKSDGSDFKNFASGLRNSVFFVWDKIGRMWGTEMGRDYLGDNVPPDEINIIQAGKNYGWPICYGNNVHDTSFDKNVYTQNPCNNKTEPQVNLQAHSAPLGLAFVPQNSNWPTAYKGDLIVAFHGSWNRSIPTGYKLEEIKLDANGNYEGVADFLTGWLQGSKVVGRPADVLFGPDGSSMFVSDDKDGVIYKITYN